MTMFFRLWVGQLLSIIGSGMTSFALGVHVYMAEGKVEQFGLLFFVGSLPRMLASPLGGVLADKFSRKKLMFFADIGGALGTLLLAFLFLNYEKPEFLLLVFGVGLISFCGGIQSPSFQSAVTQIVPKERLGQASGMLQASGAATHLISPVLAGFVYAKFGIKAIFIIDFTTFFIGATLLLFTKVPKLPVSKIQKSSMWKDIKDGFNYLLSHEILLPIIGTLTLTQFLMGFVIILIGPMILSVYTPEIYGVGQSVSAMGMMIASILFGIFGAPKKISRAFYLSLFACGLGYTFIGLGLERGVAAIIIPTFIFFFTLPYCNGIMDYFLRTKVEKEFQGRIFSLSNFMLGFATIISYITAGPLADRIFEPLFLSDKLPLVLEVLFGSGKGRGVACLLSLAGVGMVLVGLLALSKRVAGNLVLEKQPKTNSDNDYQEVSV